MSLKLRYVLDGANDGLRKRVDKWVQDVIRTKLSQGTRPQVETVHELPVVHRLTVLLQEKADAGEEITIRGH